MIGLGNPPLFFLGAALFLACLGHSAWKWWTRRAENEFRDGVA